MVSKTTHELKAQYQAHVRNDAQKLVATNAVIRRTEERANCLDEEIASLYPGEANPRFNDPMWEILPQIKELLREQPRLSAALSQDAPLIKELHEAMNARYDAAQDQMQQLRETVQETSTDCTEVVYKHLAASFDTSVERAAKALEEQHKLAAKNARAELCTLREVKDQEVKSLRNELTSMEATINTEIEKATSAKAECRTLQQQKDQEIETLEAELASAQTIYDAQLGLAADMRADEIEVLKAELAGIKKEHEAESINVGVRDEIKALKAELDTTKKEHEAKMRKNTDMGIEIKALKVELTTTKKEHESELRKSVGMGHEIEALKAELTVTKKEHEAELRKNEGVRDELIVMQHEKDAEIESLKAEVPTTKKERDAEQEIAKSLRTELRAVRRAKDEEIKAFAAELASTINKYGAERRNSARQQTQTLNRITDLENARIQDGEAKRRLEAELGLLREKERMISETQKAVAETLQNQIGILVSNSGPSTVSPHTTRSLGAMSPVVTTPSKRRNALERSSPTAAKSVNTSVGMKRTLDMAGTGAHGPKRSRATHLSTQAQENQHDHEDGPAIGESLDERPTLPKENQHNPTHHVINNEFTAPQQPPSVTFDPPDLAQATDYVKNIWRQLELPQNWTMEVSQCLLYTLNHYSQSPRKPPCKRPVACLDRGAERESCLDREMMLQIAEFKTDKGTTGPCVICAGRDGALCFGISWAGVGGERGDYDPNGMGKRWRLIRREA